MKNSMARLIITWACISALTPIMVMTGLTAAGLIVLFLMATLILNLFLKYKNPLGSDRFVRYANDSLLVFLMVNILIHSASTPMLTKAMGDVALGCALMIIINVIYFIIRSLYIENHTKRAMDAIDRHDELYELAVFGGERERVEYIKFCHKHELNNQLKKDCK